MHQAANPNDATRNLVQKINKKLALSGRFLVAKHSRGVRSYCFAVGDPRTAKYEPIDIAVDVEAEARQLGIHS